MLYPLLICGRLYGMCCMRRLLCCPASGLSPLSAPLTAPHSAAPTRSAAQQRSLTYVYHMQAHMSIQAHTAQARTYTRHGSATLVAHARQRAAVRPSLSRSSMHDTTQCALYLSFHSNLAASVAQVRAAQHCTASAARIYEHERRCTFASQTCTPAPCTNLLVPLSRVVRIASRVRIRVRVRSIRRCPSSLGHTSGRARAPPPAARSDRTSLQIIRPQQRSNAITNTRPCAHYDVARSCFSPLFSYSAFSPLSRFLLCTHSLALRAVAAPVCVCQPPPHT